MAPPRLEARRNRLNSARFHGDCILGEAFRTFGGGAFRHFLVADFGRWCHPPIDSACRVWDYFPATGTAALPQGRASTVRTGGTFVFRPIRFHQAAASLPQVPCKACAWRLPGWCRGSASLSGRAGFDFAADGLAHFALGTHELIFAL